MPSRTWQGSTVGLVVKGGFGVAGLRRTGHLISDLCPKKLVAATLGGMVAVDGFVAGSISPVVMLGFLARAAEQDEQLLRQVLVTNPAKLYT